MRWPSRSSTPEPRRSMRTTPLCISNGFRLPAPGSRVLDSRVSGPVREPRAESLAIINLESLADAAKRIGVIVVVGLGRYRDHEERVAVAERPRGDVDVLGTSADVGRIRERGREPAA